jgi:hypothetical protein
MTSLALSSTSVATGASIILDRSVKLLGLPAERTARKTLPGSADKVLRTISAILDEMVVGVIALRTEAEFKTAFAEVFPKYVELVIAFGRVASAVVPRNTIIRLSAESFSEIEADIREHGSACFGDNLRERAVFTVWTLRKTSDLLEMLQQGNIDKEQEAKDRECASEYFLHALIARFHVDCLVVAMRRNQPIYPEVVPTVDNGLLSIVDAYAWVKQAVDLRFPTNDDHDAPFVYWSSDDDALVEDSMNDLDRGAGE